jgi:quercetin dioxygenase-like cupin family protein
VPVSRKDDPPASPGSALGLATRILLGRDHGSRSLYIEEVTVAPDARIPRCVNPHTEVAVIVQEGRLDTLVGRQRTTLGPGDALLVPAGSAHGFLNRYPHSARLLFVYPTHAIERVPVSVPGATTGFLSEQGLSGYRSPADRPLGESG